MSCSRFFWMAASVVALCGPAAHGLKWQNVLTDDAIPGWEPKGEDGSSWVVQDAVLTGTGKGGAWIGTHADYTDFILDFEFKVPPGGNSGVFLRAPKEGNPAYVAMEVQILDDGADKYKNLKPAQYCGSVYMMAAPSKRVSKPAGVWNHMRVTADRSAVVVELNGETIVDIDGKSHPEILKRSPRGSIGFQNHGTPIWFRNIKLADLAADRAARSEWFRNAKFGMFIHWGVYSVLGEGEWNMKVRKITSAEYEKLPPQFNPKAFDAAQWVSLAKQAGQKYIVITTKHHDGFSMYDSKVSDYDIIDRTPFKRDPMRELADECAKQGIKLGFYHSILDWHHPDFVPVPDWDKEARAHHTPDFKNYVATLQAQVRELCTNYGPLACIWWDYPGRPKTSENDRIFSKVNAMVRQLQPDILINNRAGPPEDFSTPEQYIPPTGLTNPDGSPMLWENCITLSTGHGSHPPTAWWGYDKNEKEFKTPEFCIRMLVDVVSKGGNLLLNVGPTPQGTIRPEEADVLKAMGRWLKVNGEAIYGTTASPFRHLPFFGKATVKDNALYLHVFDWPADHQLMLPGLTNQARSARLLSDPAQKLDSQRAGSELVVHLPEQAPDPVASVVAVELDGPPVVEAFGIRPGKDGTITLPVLLADLRGRHGQRARIESHRGNAHVGNWTNKNDFVAWALQREQAGTFEVAVTYAADQAGSGGTFEVVAGQAKADTQADAAGKHDLAAKPDDMFQGAEHATRLQHKVIDTGGSNQYITETIGTINLPAGKNVVVVKAVTMPKDAGLMNLRLVMLKPAKP